MTWPTPDDIPEFTGLRKHMLPHTRGPWVDEMVQRSGAWPEFRPYEKKTRIKRKRVPLTDEEKAQRKAAERIKQHEKYVINREARLIKAKEQYVIRKAAGKLKYADLPDDVKERKKARSRAWKNAHRGSDKYKAQQAAYMKKWQAKQQQKGQQQQ